MQEAHKVIMCMYGILYLISFIHLRPNQQLLQLF